MDYKQCLYYSTPTQREKEPIYTAELQLVWKTESSLDSIRFESHKRFHSSSIELDIFILARPVDVSVDGLMLWVLK